MERKITATVMNFFFKTLQPAQRLYAIIRKIGKGRTILDCNLKNMQPLNLLRFCYISNYISSVHLTA